MITTIFGHLRQLSAEKNWRLSSKPTFFSSFSLQQQCFSFGSQSFDSFPANYLKDRNVIGRIHSAPIFRRRHFFPFSFFIRTPSLAEG
jgi:hypothetical protein